MIITKNWEVLYMNKDGINNKDHVFSLTSTNVTPIEILFPAFKTYDHFQKNKDKFVSGTILNYGGYEYIDLPLYEKIDKQYGVRYYIKSKQIELGITIAGSLNYYINLPLNNKAYFYAFSVGSKVRQTAITYWIRGSWMEGFIYEVTAKMQTRFYFCKKTQTDEYTIEEKIDDCEEKVDLLDRRGFVSNKHLYLFSNTTVMIIPEKFVIPIRNDTPHFRKGLSTPFKVIIKNYSQFFVCEGDVDGFSECKFYFFHFQYNLLINFTPNL